MGPTAMIFYQSPPPTTTTDPTASSIAFFLHPRSDHLKEGLEWRRTARTHFLVLMLKEPSVNQGPPQAVVSSSHPLQGPRPASLGLPGTEGNTSMSKSTIHQRVHTHSTLPGQLTSSIIPALRIRLKLRILTSMGNHLLSLKRTSTTYLRSGDRIVETRLMRVTDHQ
jgi:hypothetical protein